MHGQPRTVGDGDRVCPLPWWECWSRGGGLWGRVIWEAFAFFLLTFHSSKSNLLVLNTLLLYTVSPCRSWRCWGRVRACILVLASFLLRRSGILADRGGNVYVSSQLRATAHRGGAATATGKTVISHPQRRAERASSVSAHWHRPGRAPRERGPSRPSTRSGRAGRASPACSARPLGVLVPS